MSILVYGAIGAVVVLTLAIVIITTFAHALHQNWNWIPALLTLTSLLVLWLAASMPGSDSMVGSPFLILYMASIASLAAVPALVVVDVVIIVLKRQFVTVWPYHLTAFVVAGVSMFLFFVRHYYDHG